MCILSKPELLSVEVPGIDETQEIIAVDILCEDLRPARLICAYFSPTGSASVLTENMRGLCKELEQLIRVDFTTIITGDFNLPNLDWTSGGLNSSEFSKEFIFASFCSTSGLSQLVTIPTRGQNILDLLLTDDEDIVTNLITVPTPCKSDHLALSFRLLLGKTSPGMSARLNYHKSDYEAVFATLACTNWRSFFLPCESVDSQYNAFRDYVAHLVTGHTPRTGKMSSPIEHFLAKGAVRLLNLQPNKLCHSRLSKELSKAARRLRKLQESELQINNAKEFFRYARSRIKLPAPIGPLVLGDRTATSDSDKAEILSTHFRGVFLQSSSFNFNNCSFQGDCNDVSFDQFTIALKLKELKRKSCLTPDGLPPIIFRELDIALAEPLSIIFTRSFEDGVVPFLFKESIVTPIHKKGARSVAANYRPIAQSTVACLVMEKIMVDCLSKYLSSNGLFDENQHGFTKGRSTGTQLLEVVHTWALAKNCGLPLHTIYFDFSHAFDCVDHGLLLHKMSAIGIGPKILKWCQSYLSGRTFRVKVGDALSISRPSPSGVPQGSCLGPLLFCIFVLDLKQALAQTNVAYKLYADDLKVYAMVKNANDVLKLQQSIEAISKWASSNKMEISMAKCAVLKTAPDDVVYTLNGCPIACVTSYKDLGVTFQSDMKFRQHIVNVTKSSARLSNLILRTFVIQDPKVYLRLFSSLVVPILTYCSHVWGPFYKKDLRLLDRVQQKFVNRVASRCAISRDDIVLPEMRDRFYSIDTFLFKQLVFRKEVFKYFVIRKNRLRSGVTILPPQIATNEIVNNAFAWRLARRAHSCDKFAAVILSLFKEGLTSPDADNLSCCT